MRPVPTYSLYGVNSSEPLSDQLHFESIAARSRLHGWEIKPHRHERFLICTFMRVAAKPCSKSAASRCAAARW
ncbi:hypothetical protein Tamer19_50880 [Cupriavidus sp. TA19]|nr:hypothetical protein Tamer19_50880 [Cupriavidus sp. TA19]